jgi:hypothetical protein
MCTVGCVRTCSSVDESRKQNLEPDPAEAMPAVPLATIGLPRPRPAS